jgi:hypothetical protein
MVKIGLLTSPKHSYEASHEENSVYPRKLVKP